MLIKKIRVFCNITRSSADELWRSFTYKRTSNGPNIKPCGTSQQILLVFATRSWFIEIYCTLFVRQLRNHARLMPLIPYIASFLIKRNAQFLFLCNTQKSGASQVCIIFPQVTQKKKIQTKDITHWLELITEILSFLHKYSV